MARNRKLLWQIFIPFFLIVMVSLSAVAWYASNSLSRFYRNQARRELRERAMIIKSLVEEDIQKGKYDLVNRRCRELGRATSTRVTVVLRSGEIVADSDENPEEMDDHSKRPEIRKAFKGEIGVASRYSKTLGKEMMYLAVPLHGRTVERAFGKDDDDEVRAGAKARAKAKAPIRAFVRVSVPVKTIKEKTASMHRDILTGGAVVALLAVLVSFWVSHRINSPILEMKRGAERFARGELDYRLATGENEEVAALADAMNNMAQQLGERIDQITKQRNERDAVLFSMVEAVFAVDMEERFIRCNRAAKILFGVGEDEVVLKRPFRDVIRNSDLESFVTKTLSASEAVSGEIRFHSGRSRYLHAQGAGLRDESGESMGALIVLHDVTKLKRLEAIRTEFVANVSHELKTPIASIKGSAETLKDGAIDDPNGAKQFLDMIVRHTARLASIIDDLLILSRIEQDESDEMEDMSLAPISPVLHSAMLAVREKAKQKDIEFKVDCSSSLHAFISPRLLEHAVINLLDNAVKYSDKGGSVKLSALEEEDRVVMTVEDQGCGISEEHQERVFERFYRVDKARSRKLGGTGLGLAIVKHIATAHNGSVKVESELGKGSRFTISLPKS